jgi:hypothetical protein
MNRFERLTLVFAILRNEELSVLCSSLFIVGLLDGMMPVSQGRETSNACGLHVGCLGKCALIRPRRRWEDDLIRVCMLGVGFEGGR